MKEIDKAIDRVEKEYTHLMGIGSDYAVEKKRTLSDLIDAKLAIEERDTKLIFLEDDNKRLMNEIDSLKGQIENTKKLVDTAKAQNDVLKAHINAVESNAKNHSDILKAQINKMSKDMEQNNKKNQEHMVIEVLKIACDVCVSLNGFRIMRYLVSTMRDIEKYGAITTKTLPYMTRFLGRRIG